MILDIFTPYPATVGSTRVRTVEWVKFTSMSARMHSFSNVDRYSELANSPSGLARVVAAQVRALAASSHSWDNVLISRAVSPLGGGSLEERILRKSTRGVFDFDDAIMLPTGERRLGLRVFDAEERFKRAVKAASCVIAGNDWLAERANRYSRRVTVIPSCVDPGAYERKTEYHLSTTPRLVWIGSFSTEVLLYPILPALTRLSQLTGATLTIIGASSANPRLDPLPFITRIPWSLAHQSQLARYDVALSPVSGGEWELGKCGYKTLQYGAAAIPVVGSPMGVNSDILSKFDAPRPTTCDEWFDAVLEMVNSEGRRRAVGQRARKAVEMQYSFTVWRDRWLRAVTGS